MQQLTKAVQDSKIQTLREIAAMRQENHATTMTEMLKLQKILGAWTTNSKNGSTAP